MDQNHVKVRIVEFVVHIAVEIIPQNCSNNLLYRMVTQQINNRDKCQTDLYLDNLIIYK